MRTHSGGIFACSSARACESRSANESGEQTYEQTCMYEHYTSTERAESRSSERAERV
jgi:hypothetical protein